MVQIRRPGENLKSLYDVFEAIREDEGDHVKTMQACLDPSENLRAPSLEKKALTGAGILYLLTSFLSDSVEVEEIAANLDLQTIAQRLADMIDIF